MSTALRPNSAPSAPPGDLARAVHSGRRSPSQRESPRSAATDTTGPFGQALTLVLAVKAGHRERLVTLLEEMGTAIGKTPAMAFERLRTVHFMRWVVIDAFDDPASALLVFESNHDGPVERHIEELLREGAVAIHAIYGHCAGYPIEAPAVSPTDYDAVTRYLQDHRVDYAARFVGTPSISAQRILLEEEIRAALSEFLNAHTFDSSWLSTTSGEKYARLRDLLRERGLLDTLLALDPASALSTKQSRLQWIARLAALAIPLVPFLLPLGLVLAIKEKNDRVDSYGATPAWVQKLAEREDFQVQNQLTHLVAVKPGLFRRWLLKLVLYSIDVLARYEFTEGSLGGITSIHYARWLFVDGGKRLLFFSNYDGSWESYLGDFVDIANIGLTAVWSNTEGFPRTTLLLSGGASDEDRFKAWTRAHQVPTPLWYSAYPTLTVRNILSNARISAGLVSPPRTEADIESWLQLL